MPEFKEPKLPKHEAKATKPIPYKFLLDKRIKANEKENQDSNTMKDDFQFKAIPVPNFEKLHTQNTIKQDKAKETKIKPMEFNFNLNERVVKRKRYLEEQENMKSMYEDKIKQAQAEQELKKKEELKQLRNSMEFKARQIYKGKTFQPKKSQQKPTKPIAHKFHTSARSLSKQKKQHSEQEENEHTLPPTGTLKRITAQASKSIKSINAIRNTERNKREQEQTNLPNEEERTESNQNRMNLNSEELMQNSPVLQNRSHHMNDECAQQVECECEGECEQNPFLRESRLSRDSTDSFPPNEDLHPFTDIQNLSAAIHLRDQSFNINPNLNPNPFSPPQFVSNFCQNNQIQYFNPSQQQELDDCVQMEINHNQ